MTTEEEFERVIKEMEWGEVVDTLQAVIDITLGGTSNPSYTPPPPPPVTDGLGYDIAPQPVDSLYVSEAHGGCSAHYLGTAPHNIAQPVMPPQVIMQPGYLYCQPGVHSQGQHMLYPSAVYDHPGTSAAAYHPAAPPHTYNNAPMISFYESTGHNLLPLRLVNGEVVHEIPADGLHQCNSAAPPAPTTKSKKRKREKQQDDGRPYIKKPLNAFMLFMKEQRPNVVSEMNIKDNAKVNGVLGQRWASLSKEEQASYYKKAEEEKLLHSQQNPGWSSSDNYGKKRRRQRCRASTAAESSAPKPEEVKETNNQRVINLTHCLGDPSPPLLPTPLLSSPPLSSPLLPSSPFLESSTPQSVVETLPDVENPVAGIQYFTMDLQQLHELLFLDPPGEAALMSPTAPTTTGMTL